jgi:hypothetical protein
MISPNENALEHIKELAEQGFWGTVKLQIQKGQIIHLVEERSFKPEQLIPEHRRSHEHNTY